MNTEDMKASIVRQQKTIAEHERFIIGLYYTQLKETKTDTHYRLTQHVKTFKELI